MTDWTFNARTGRSNDSPEFRRMVAVVSEIIRDDAHRLLRGYTDATARLILAQLTHRHGFTKPRART